MSDSTEQPKKERFAPKEAVTLQPPKDDPIDREYLAKCDGMAALHNGSRSSMFTYMFLGTNEGYPTLVAIKVTLYSCQALCSFAKDICRATFSTSAAKRLMLQAKDITVCPTKHELPRAFDLTWPLSVRWQGAKSRIGAFLTQTRRLCFRLLCTIIERDTGSQRLAHLFQQALQHCRALAS